MASTYSPSLKLELMATGDQSGTWGVTNNLNLGTLLEQAITGVLSVAQGDVANLTLTDLDGASDQARNAVVNLTGAMTANRNVVVPTANKLYIVKNSTTGGFAVTVKTAAGTGVSIANGTAQWVYCDGTNVVQGLSGTLAPQSAANVAITGGTIGAATVVTLTNSTGLPIIAGTTGTLTEVRGGTNQTTYATGDTLYASGTNTLAKRTIGATGQLLTVSGGVPTWSALTDAIEFVIDAGAVAITTGVKGDLLVPFGCTIVEWTLLADQSGSIVVDIWKDSYANYPPVVGDSITASLPPTISTAVKGQSTTLTGWTTAITAGDTLRFNVNSVTSIQRVTLALRITRP